MTKHELIAKVQQSLKIYTQKDIAYVVEIMFSSMIDALKRHERIDIRNFGNFTVRERKPRMARNPKSGESVNLEERWVPFFKTGKELRVKVNKNES